MSLERDTIRSDRIARYAEAERFTNEGQYLPK